MANYECVVRTNYFHVKDEERFRALMDVVSAGNLEFWEKKDEKGSPTFAFGSDGTIYGISNITEGSKCEADEEFCDEFLYQLKDLVADSEAVIIMEAGHEKLKYVTGTATVITSRAVVYIDLDKAACESARGLLDNPDYDPVMCY